MTRAKGSGRVHPQSGLTVPVCLLYVCILYLTRHTSFPREVGGRRLEVGTNMARDLPESTGELSLEGLSFWKTAFSAMTRTPSTLHPQGPSVAPGPWSEPAGDRKTVLMPCRTPPSLDSVRLWLEARRQYQRLQGARGEGASEGPPAGAPRSRRSPLKLLVRSPAPPSQVGAQTQDHARVEDPALQGGGGGGTQGSPESPDLPPWQDPSQTPGAHQEQQEEEEEEGEEEGEEEQWEGCGVPLSPSPFPSRRQESGRSSPRALHSTPLLRRRGRRRREELVCSTPLADGATSHILPCYRGDGSGPAGPDQGPIC